MKNLFLLAAVAISTSAFAASENLANGIRIDHVKVGSGPSPTAKQVVLVNYRGTLANGTEFDSSYKRGQPAGFPLSRVIPCWTVGIQQMKVGGKAVLTCPPETAYGSAGVGNVIPPNATLTFEVELLNFQ